MICNLYGCGTQNTGANLSKCSADVTAFAASKGGKIVGLGEASHGVSEYHQMKMQIFQALVENSVCRTFIIEGDFGSVLFINGHNGHIARTSAIAYTCLGERLAQTYGSEYYAIGTDALETSFQSKGADGFSIMTVTNQNLMNELLTTSDQPYYFIEFANVTDDTVWQQILTQKMRFTTLNVGIEDWQTAVPAFYTLQFVPMECFDAMIVFGSVGPTQLYD